MAILVLGGLVTSVLTWWTVWLKRAKKKLLSWITWWRVTVRQVHPDAVFYEGDLADQDFMRKVFKENPDVDAVIHFADYSLVAESMEKPLKYFDNNTSGMVKLLEVMN